MGRGDDTKSRILLAAAGLFSERGYEVVTMREIASSVGIKCSSLYNYFDGKNDIMDSIIEYFMSHISQYQLNVENVDNLLTTETPELILRRLIQLYPNREDSLKRYMFRIIFMEQYRNEKIRSLFMEEIVRRNVLAIKSVIGRLVELRAIPPCDCQAIANIWIKTSLFYAMEWTHGIDGDFTYEGFCDSIIGAVLGRPHPSPHWVPETESV